MTARRGRYGGEAQSKQNVGEAADLVTWQNHGSVVLGGGGGAVCWFGLCSGQWRLSGSDCCR
ncbi:hypothetical protein WN943_016885 [Citrus x changshan-huyou]